MPDAELASRASRHPWADVERAAQRAVQAHHRTDEAHRSAPTRNDEVALVHERFAEEHQSAAESLPDDLAEAHRGAADKHRQAASKENRGGPNDYSDTE
jgi:hypothetical protein